MIDLTKNKMPENFSFSGINWQPMVICDFGGVRTPNPRSRNPIFYPVELRSLFYIIDK